MKYVTIIIITLSLAVGCKTDFSRSRIIPAEEEPTQQNTILEKAIEETNIAFDQFAYDYSIDKNYRLEHTIFPLPIITEEDTLMEKRENWNPQALSFGIEFSTILYSDSIIDENRSFYNSINENSANVRYFSPLDSKIFCFNFERRQGTWMLTSVEINKMSNLSEESFFTFISKFGFNTSFAQSRISDNATYTDRDEETMLEKTEPFDPKNISEQGYLFKMIYLPKRIEHKDQMTIYVKGEGTGYHDELYFMKFNKRWYLYKEVNLGM